MTPEFFKKWEHIIDSVDKTNFPIEFVKKIVIKLSGRKQRTINVQSLFKQGLESDEIEAAIVRKLDEFGQEVVGMEFILDVEGIADTVQPEVDYLLKSVK